MFSVEFLGYDELIWVLVDCVEESDNIYILWRRWKLMVWGVEYGFWK